VVVLLLGVACSPRAVTRASPLAQDAAPLDASADDAGPGDDRPASQDLRSDGPAGAEAAPAPEAGPKPDAGRPDAPADQRPPDAGLDAGADAASRKALLVVAIPTPLPTDDAKLKMRIEGDGYLVTVGDDDGLGDQATGMDLVVISATSAAAKVAAKYQSVAIPVVCLDPGIFPAMQMAGPTQDTDFGQTNGTQISVAPAMAAHPLAGGQTGTLVVTTAAIELAWGNPAPAADHVATLAGMANRWAVFGYDRGAMMVGTTPAPARRVGVFIYAGVADRITPAGWQLFDAALAWATAR
jgi:hypothetical protein